jgi:hypothetical protein
MSPSLEAYVRASHVMGTIGTGDDRYQLSPYQYLQDERRMQQRQKYKYTDYSFSRLSTPCLKIFFQLTVLEQMWAWTGRMLSDSILFIMNR